MNQNQRAITPVTSWVNGESKTMTVLQLDNYAGYNFLNSPGYVTYTLCAEVQTDDGQGNITTITQGVVCGQVDLTWPLVEAWGMDDQPIFIFVAEQLNLTLV